MTVAIEIVCGDGVVISADSRTTLQLTDTAPTRVLSDFTHKVFQAGECAIASWGWAFLEQRNIAGHMSQFVAEIDSESASDLAGELAAYFGDRIDRHIAAGGDEAPPEGADVLGFFVGGYEEGAARAYEVSLPSRSVNLRHDSVANPGAAWRGQTDVIRRLIKGVDWDLLQELVTGDEKQAVLNELKPDLDALEYLVPFQYMTLQDAVDFAVFAIRTTIDTQRLTYGTPRSPGSWPGVGGPIEIAAVTPTEGFAWIQSTELQGERWAGEAEEI